MTYYLILLQMMPLTVIADEMMAPSPPGPAGIGGVDPDRVPVPSIPPRPQKCRGFETDRCESNFDGSGVCVNTTDANWAALDHYLDLTIPSRSDLCVNPLSKDPGCCACFKRRNCLDRGCSDNWGGRGICLKTTNSGFARHSSNIDFSVGGRDDLCPSLREGDNCCTCFKQITAGCRPRKKVGGVEYKLSKQDKKITKRMRCQDDCIYRPVVGGQDVCFQPDNLLLSDDLDISDDPAISDALSSETDCPKSCSPGWTEIGFQCYIVGKDQKTWTEAQTACQVLQASANLASITSASLETTLLSLVGGPAWANEYWTGGNDQADNGNTFVWALDNLAFWKAGPPKEKIGYSNWYVNKAATQPNHANSQDCVKMKIKAKEGVLEAMGWDDVGCNKTLKYACQYSLAGM